MLEKQFDEMLEDIESANDEFVNDYFSSMDELVFDDEDLTPKEEAPVVEETTDDDKEEKSEKEEANKSEEVEDEKIEEVKEDALDEVKEEPIYKNRFTSFSKTNLNKTCSKNIKVYHKNKFEKKEEKKKEEQPKQTFSYNKILDRLDQEKKYDLNNVNDLMKLIDKCETSAEFFNYIESEQNDK